MTPEEAREALAEAKMRNDTMGQTVGLMNLFGQFIGAEVNSPMEDQLSAMLDDVVGELVRQGDNGLIGNILLSLCAVVANCADPEKVQEFLDDATADIQRVVDEARGYTN
jgi:hypothetical protein